MYTSYLKTGWQGVEWKENDAFQEKHRDYVIFHVFNEEEINFMQKIDK